MVNGNAGAGIVVQGAFNYQFTMMRR
jgi:hypothetical protein